MDLWLLSLIAFIAGYLPGSIPFGLLIGKWAGLGDIRKQGSGNIGATNMLRIGGKKLATITLLADILKGALPVAIMQTIWGFEMALITAFATVIGHMFPIWLKFKGGKGVATSIGAFIGLSSALGFIVIICWLLTAKLSKISSLSALVATGMAPIFSLIIFGGESSLYILAITVMVWIRHHENIKRLLKREEPKIGNSKG